MSPSSQGAARPSRTRMAAWRLTWLGGVLLAVLFALLLGPAVAQAGTITIVDGPNTPPVGGVFNDGFLQAQLAAGSYVITTTSVITGPNEIRVLGGAVIVWTTGTTLTLDAGSRVIISGTIQHNGPVNGAGGVRLLANDSPDGAVLVGTGSQSAGVAVGSRHGLTQVEAGSLSLRGAGGTTTYAQLGFHAVNQGLTYTVTGPISVTAGALTATGGLSDYDYVQIGHGGSEPSFLSSPSGSFSGPIAVEVSGDVTFQAGAGSAAFAQLGNGGVIADGNHSGSHHLAAGGDVRFVGGGGVYAFAQMGNGGINTNGNHGGDHSLHAGGDVSFLGGSDAAAYAQLGNGGLSADGDHRGSLTLELAGSLNVIRGSGDDAYAMIGHGSDGGDIPGLQSTGSREGEISVRVGATAVFSASQVGHLTAGGVVSVTQGSTLIGVSQNDPFTTGTGQLLVTGVTTSSFSSAADTNGGELRFYLPREESQQIPTNATFNGETFAVTNTIPAAQLAGIAQFGDGPYLAKYSFYVGGQPNAGVSKTATPAGSLLPGQSLTYTLSFSNTGTVTATGVVLTDTLPAAVAFTRATLQPDTGVTITQMSGPPNLVWSVSSLGLGKGGRIRIVASVQNTGPSPSPAPARSSAPSATTTVEVRSNFFTPDPITITVGSAVRWTRIEGFHNVLADDDSFTSGDPSSTWTTFEHAFNSAGTFPYHCEVHGAGMAGTVIVTEEPAPTAAFTNTATITASGDITLSNNSASVVRGILPGATLTITKTVVGSPPANAWQFTGSGGIGSFSLPAGGGSRSFSGLIPTAYTITETTRAGYSAAVACSSGASGTNSVQVTLSSGAGVACVFTNTAGGSGAGVKVWGPAVFVGP